MTLKQQVLRWVYPILMIIKKKSRRSTHIENNSGKAPVLPFYSLEATDIDGNRITFDVFRKKKVLIVNTASDCGYTAQYKELQALQERFSDELVILGFPSNDFNNQEKGSNTDIRTFCMANYAISFPLMSKSSVLKTGNQDSVYQWLTYSEENGWNEHAPDWNFSKYLINELGILTHYFGPAVSPSDKMVINAIKNE